MVLVDRRRHSKKRESAKSSGLISGGAHRIVQTALRPDVSVLELAEMAACDPAFALRILSVANSAAYARGHEIQSVHHACSLLGLRGLRNVALGMLVTDLVPAAEGAGTLFSNCLRRAIVARELARHSALVSPEEGFFTGLLLEVGLLQQACDEFEDALIAARAPGRYRVIQERAVGLAPHPERGAELARELALPESMVSAIRLHHSPLPPTEPLALLAWVSEFAASALEGAHERRSLQLAESAAFRVGVGPQVFAELLARVPDEVTELSAVFESPAGLPNVERRGPASVEDELDTIASQYEDLVRVVERLLGERETLENEVESLRDLLGQRTTVVGY